jgi:Zn-dependent M16 (insulinase) family peptidase
MNWSVGTSLDRKLYVAFDVLDYCLVSAPGAVLKKALIDKGIGKDVYSEYENGVLQPFFSVIAKNANADQADLFKQTIIECLEKTVKEGLDKKALEAAINVDEFKYREADFGRFPKGLLYGLQVLDSWLYDDMKPFIHIEAGDTYKALRDEIEGDYFEKLIQEYLLDNTHSSMFIMDPVKGLNEEKEAAKSAELQKYKESLTKKDIDRIVRETAELKEYQEAPDLEENLKKIPMLTRKDLRRNVEPFIYEEKKVWDNILLFHDIFTNGIDYLNFVFRMEDVPYELFKYSGILKSVLGLVDTKNYSYGDLYNEINMKTGGFTASIGTYSDRRDLSKFATTFEIAVKVLPSNIDHAFDLATEIIRTSKIDDMKRMKEILDEKMSHMDADLQTAGHRAAALHAAAGFSKAGNVSENLSGITGYRLVQKYAKHYDEAAHKELVEKLSELMKTLFRKENLLVSFTTDKKNYGQIEAKVAEFADNLYTQDCQKGRLEFVPVKSNDAFKTPGQVQYTALAGNFRKNGLEYTGALRVLQVMMGYDFLWNNIRVKGGAYGVMGGASPNGDSYFVTYRDPHLKRSLDVFRQVSDFVRNYEADERTLTGFVIGAIGELDTPKTPSAKGSYGLMAYMCHADIDKLQEHRDQILDVTVEDIRKLADYVDAFEEDNSICVVGTSEKINQHRDLFDKVEEL